MIPVGTRFAVADNYVPAVKNCFFWQRPYSGNILSRGANGGLYSLHNQDPTLGIEVRNTYDNTLLGTPTWTWGTTGEYCALFVAKRAGGSFIHCSAHVINPAKDYPSVPLGQAVLVLNTANTSVTYEITNPVGGAVLWTNTLAADSHEWVDVSAASANFDNYVRLQKVGGGGAFLYPGGAPQFVTGGAVAQVFSGSSTVAIEGVQLPLTLAGPILEG